MQQIMPQFSDHQKILWRNTNSSWGHHHRWNYFHSAAVVINSHNADEDEDGDDDDADEVYMGVS